MKIYRKRVVDGNSFVEADEEFQKKRRKKINKEMDTAGIATELKRAKKKMGKSNLPKLKTQKM